MSDLIVVIPGILGSILRDDRGKEIWTIRGRRLLPMLARLVMNRSLLELSQGFSDRPVNDGIEPAGLLTDLHAIPGLWTINGYDGLVRWLTSRFEVDEILSNGQPGNLVLFSYDWRLSNRNSARRLAATVDRRLAKWRKTSGNDKAKATLICHSMGGLVARWFLDLEGGASLCRRLITIGTPYQGAPEAIAALANGVHPGLGPLKADLTRLVRTLPSVSELMATYPCVDRGDGVLVSLSEADIPQIAKSTIEWGARFHADLTTVEPIDGSIGYQTIALKGQSQPTNQVVRVTGEGVELDDLEKYDDGQVPYRRRTRETNQLEMVINVRGDGTVPRGSSHPKQWKSEAVRPAGDKVQGFAPKHANLQNQREVLESLFQIFTADRLGQTAGGVPIAVSGPEMSVLGEPVKIDVSTDPAFDDLMLEIHVDNDPGQATYLNNIGEGRYRGEVHGLAPDVHELTVTATPGGLPITDVTHLVTVADNNVLEQLVDDLDLHGGD
jgi:hypothetical protein